MLSIRGRIGIVSVVGRRGSCSRVGRSRRRGGISGLVSRSVSRAGWRGMSISGSNI